MEVAKIITDKLTATFLPHHLEVINESNRHHVPPNSETHFKLVIVSDKVDGMRLIARHRMVNDILAEQLAGGVHALTMHIYTKNEWDELIVVPDSPKCKG